MSEEVHSARVHTPLETDTYNADNITVLRDQFKDEVGQGVFMSPSLEDFSFRYVLMPVRFANSASA